MAIGNDFEVTAGRDIRYTGSGDRYTVLELYRWLQDLADDPTASGDDLVDILSPNVGIRRFDTIIELINGFNIDDTTAQYLYAGSITQDDGDTRYSGLAIVGDFPSGPPRVIQNNSILTTFWGATESPDEGAGVAIRILVKTINGGTLIDGGRVRVSYRYYGDQYREAGTVLGVGEAVAAPGNIQIDTFNAIDIGDITGAPYNTITRQEGFRQIDLNNGNGDRPYYVEWGTGDTDLAGLYNRVKWLTRDGSTETVFGMDGQLFRGITHEVAISSPTGTFDAVEPVSWSGGTGQMLAIDSPTAGTRMFLQLLTGATPATSATITGGSSGATAVAGAVTVRPLGVESALGSFVGAVLGAFGVGFDPGDLTVADSLIDLNNATQQPPNNVQVIVAGVLGGHDYVLLGRSDMGDLLTDQFTLAAGNTLGNGTLVVKEAIPSDTPSTGYVRVWNGTAFNRYPYTSWSGSTFTLDGTLAETYVEDDPAFVPFLDQLAAGGTVTNTIVYSTSIPVVGVVRGGTGPNPIVPFPLSGTIGAAGFSVTAVRQSDA